LAWSLDELEDLLSTASSYDPETGAPMPVKVSQFVAGFARALHGDVPIVPRDALFRVAELASAPLEEVLDDPRHRLQRSHQTLRPERVRNVDARSMAWLARQPGHDIRQKLSSSRRMLAVVRHPTADVPANRFVRRFALDLASCLDRVLASAGMDFEDDARRRQLWMLRERCRLDREGAPLADVRAAVAPTPDNVLLGDRRYARLWRAWRVLGALDDITAARWRTADAWLSSTVAWAIVAELARAPNATLEDRWIALQENDPGPDERGVRVRIRDDGGVRVFSIRAVHGGLEIDVERWRGDRRLSMEDEPPVVIGCGFQAVGAEFDGPGHPATLDLPSGPLTFQVRRHVLADVAGRVVRSLGVMDSDRPVAETTAVDSVPWVRSGIDFAGPCVHIVRDGAPLPTWVALARSTSRDDAEAWVAGESAVRWDDRERGSEWSAIDLWRAAASVGLGTGEVGSLQALAESARERLGEARASAEVAVAVPDGLDEASLATLRSAIGPAVAGRPWWIWRSAAAVIGWRARGAPSLAEGDAVVVLDLAMPGFGGATLIARRTGNGGDDWFFERPLPGAFRDVGEEDDPGAILAQAISASQTSDGTATPSGVIDVAVSRGLSHWSANGEWLSGGQDGGRWNVTADPAAAVALLGQRAVAWARRFEQGTALVRARERSSIHRLHLLIVGSPFGSSEGEAVAAALTESVQWCRGVVAAPDAVGDLVARGADEFLARRALGLPTWVDLLPQLSLEVLSRGAVKKIVVFPRKSVRAGESVTYRVKESFQIPRGRRSIVLPLLRDDDGRRIEDTNAVIEHPSFPLERAVEVRAEVHFRHAEDGFRIVLTPTDTAPFPSLDVHWARRDTAPQVDASVIDEPPAWPRVPGWNEVPDELIRSLEEAILHTGNAGETVSSNQVPVRLNAAKKGEPARSKLVQDLQALAATLRRVGSEASVLFVSGRSAMTLPPSLARSLPLLEELARGNRQLLSCTLTEVQKAARDVAAAATNAVSRFRATASDAFVRWGLDPANPLSEGDRWRSLARTMGDGAAGARAQAREALTDRLRGPTPPGVDLLWVASTALWGDPGFVFSVGPAVETWWQAIELALEGIEGDTRPGPAGARFDECLAILVGLLRLRGSEHGTAVSARNERVVAMADRIDRLGRSLPAGRKPRLRLEGGQALWEATANLLRGQSVARIEMIADEG